MLDLKHRRAWLAASLLLVLTVVWGSLQTQVDLGAVPDGFDKVEHFGTYGFLMAWFGGMVPASRYLRVALALLALGLSMEILQYLMGAGRDADPYDMLANTLGVGLGLALTWWRTGGWTLKVEAWLSRI